MNLLHTTRLGFAALAAAALGACATLSPPQTVEVSLFALNDFHGYIQSANPLPARLSVPDPARPGETRTIEAGGAAHIATALTALRANAPASLLIGAGDLIGASPTQSAFLRDEPTITILNELGMSVSSIGNHELDRGQAELLERASGQCGSKGCALEGFSGAKFDYLAANVVRREDGRPWLKPWVERTVGGQRIAFIGAVTRTLPNMVSTDALQGLRFDDEADAINRFVPEIRASGIETIVALIHEGGDFAGPLNDPSYRCEGLSGPIIDIVNRLDPAIDAVFSAHTHNGYTCRINGRLVVQGRNYGAAISEIRLTIDPRSHDVTASRAEIHPVEQARYPEDPAIARSVAALESKTAQVRSRVLTRLPHGLRRQPDEGASDSPFGTVVADAQLAAARLTGPTDLAFTNPGGVRTDLPAQFSGDGEVTITHGDAFAAQPFNNHVIVMSLSGQDLLAVLQQQFRDDPAKPLLLHASSNLGYRWRTSGEPAARLSALQLDGQPIDPARQYRVAVNSFLSTGGDGFSAFTRGTARVDAGSDLDALESYLVSHPDRLAARSTGRIRPLAD